MDDIPLTTAVDLYKHALSSANALWTFYIGVATVFVALGFSDKIKLNRLGAAALTIAFVLFAIGNSLALNRSHKLLASSATYIKARLPQIAERAQPTTLRPGSPFSESLEQRESVERMIAPLDDTGPGPVLAMQWIVSVSLLAVFWYGHTRVHDAKVGAEEPVRSL